MLSPQDAKAARVALKISQTQAADAIGLSRTYVSLFEGGKYILDDEKRSALRKFYEGRGHVFKDVNANSPTPAAVRPPTTNTPPVSSTHTRQDARLQSAINAIRDLRTCVSQTGRDSKRTVAALSGAYSSLSHLDYPEVIALARSDGSTVDGIPTAEVFRSLPLHDKEVWESRACCGLLCGCLYGADWAQNDARVWERVNDQLVAGRWLDKAGYVQRPFFGSARDDQAFVIRSRTQLAPALVRAATHRAALSLSRRRTFGTASRLSFPKPKRLIPAFYPV